MKKVILQLDLHDDEDKQEAMKRVCGISGIVIMDMKDKKLTVIGDVDPVGLVSKLRKLCHTEIVAVGPAMERKKEALKKDDPKEDKPEDEDEDEDEEPKEDGPKKKKEPKKGEKKEDQNNKGAKPECSYRASTFFSKKKHGCYPHLSKPCYDHNVEESNAEKIADFSRFLLENQGPISRNNTISHRFNEKGLRNPEKSQFLSEIWV